jgi:hypothetical protein
MIFFNPLLSAAVLPIDGGDSPIIESAIGTVWLSLPESSSFEPDPGIAIFDWPNPPPKN